ncbi:hypothetical protein FPANT_465 [Fusarium pseudoanthophilum]|uniref:Uncharacterized protein n=1 Tax=Fusarium pseudoanthophilum TaxID=48495 RepID=A0A8H5Q6T4_9HYPO|nr:hypothetical protein FPANT_465 [Fusarium pseudoanthophilum]
MGPKASETTAMAAEKPFNHTEEMLSKESVEKPDITDEVTKTLGTEAVQVGVKIVNGRRFTFRDRDSNGKLLPPNKHWTDEEGNSEGHDEELWEKKLLLRDWIYGRMSPEEFDAHFPWYMGPPKEWYRINKEADGMQQEEKQDVSDVRSSDSREFNENNGKEDVSCKEDDSRYEDDSWYEKTSWNEEEAGCIVNDHTLSMLIDEYYACLNGDDGDLSPQPSKEPPKTEEGFVEDPTKADDKEKPRYAQHYGDGSGLPLRPGMGPPLTEEQQAESFKKWQAESERLWNMTDEEFYAQCPEYEAIKDHRFPEGEAEEMLEREDNENPIYASYYGDGSGLPLRPGMGPPPTKEEYLESWRKPQEQFESHWNLTDEEEKLLKKWRAEADKIFDMSDEEFNAEFPEREDNLEWLCTEEEGLRLMEECEEDHARRREKMIRKWKESGKARPEDQQ